MRRNNNLLWKLILILLMLSFFPFILGYYIVKFLINYNSENNISSGKLIDFIALDLETTGLEPSKSEIIEIAAIKFSNGMVVDKYHTLINPTKKISKKITEINGITNEMVKDSPSIEIALPSLLKFLDNNLIVAHNAEFDIKFLKHNLIKCKIEANINYADTLELSRKMFPNLPNHKLATVVEHLNILSENFHRAEEDALYCGTILLKCLEINKSCLDL